ncbi:MAG: histidine phosphatase family protein [Betaproteobacteria bacterium]|nr:histidine phosphatase family protein [Betaproteobacteria bacterium]
MSIDQIPVDTPLSETGHQRAKELASRLRGAGITAIYATDALRTVQTAEPLAKMLNLQIRQIPRKDTAALVSRLRGEHQKDRVLVVSHWNNLPEVLKALGHPVEVKLERRAYDEIFVVVPGNAKQPLVVQFHY